MRYTCTHRHPTTGKPCTVKARPGLTVCGRHLDAASEVEYHPQRSGKRIRIGRTRVRPLNHKPSMIG